MDILWVSFPRVGPCWFWKISRDSMSIFHTCRSGPILVNIQIFYKYLLHVWVGPILENIQIFYEYISHLYVRADFGKYLDILWVSFPLVSPGRFWKINFHVAKQFVKGKRIQITLTVVVEFCNVARGFGITVFPIPVIIVSMFVAVAVVPKRNFGG